MRNFKIAIFLFFFNNCHSQLIGREDNLCDSNYICHYYYYYYRIVSDSSYRKETLKEFSSFIDYNSLNLKKYFFWQKSAIEGEIVRLVYKYHIKDEGVNALFLTQALRKSHEHTEVETSEFFGDYEAKIWYSNPKKAKDFFETLKDSQEIEYYNALSPPSSIIDILNKE